MTAQHKVYRIYDNNGMTYIGSTELKMGQRISSHKQCFIKKVNWKLYNHWNNIGWDSMKFDIIIDNIPTKLERRKLEDDEIRKIDKSKRLNSIKANCPNYEATRSVNSECGEIDKILSKRKNRIDFYNRHMQDPIWHEKEKERNKIRMRNKRKKKIARS